MVSVQRVIFVVFTVSTANLMSGCGREPAARMVKCPLSDPGEARPYGHCFYGIDGCLNATCEHLKCSEIELTGIADLDQINCELMQEGPTSCVFNGSTCELLKSCSSISSSSDTPCVLFFVNGIRCKGTGFCREGRGSR